MKPVKMARRQELITETVKKARRTELITKTVTPTRRIELNITYNKKANRRVKNAAAKKAKFCTYVSMK